MLPSAKVFTLGKRAVQGCVLNRLSNALPLVRKELQRRYKLKSVECYFLGLLGISIVCYQTIFLASSCQIGKYLYYQGFALLLLLGYFSLEVGVGLAMRELIRFIPVNEEKNLLQQINVRMLIYRFETRTNRVNLVSSSSEHLRRYLGYISVLVFLGQVGLANDHGKFSCFISYEPLIMNITGWTTFGIVIALSNRKIKKDYRIEAFADESIIELEHSWSLRGSKVRLSKKKQAFEQTEQMAIKTETQALHLDQGDVQQIAKMNLAAEQLGSQMKEAESTEECMICLSGIEEETLVREMRCCMKVFHISCSDKWFSTKSSCPNCRGYPSDYETTVQCQEALLKKQSSSLPQGQ